MPVAKKVCAIEPLDTVIVAGTVTPGETVAFELSATEVDAESAAENVTEHVSTSPGSIWLATALGTPLVSGAQVMAMVGETVTVNVGTAIEDSMATPNALETETPDSVIVAEPAGAVVASTAATLAMTPLAMVVEFIPATTQFN